MRVVGLVCAIAMVLGPGCLYAQASEHHAAAVPEQTNEPYHKHHDTRHGHDHFYPDRGAIVRDLPKGTVGLSYAGVSYRYHDAIWLEPRGPAYIVIAPPIGLIAPTLPLYSTVVKHGPDTYLYANDTYYRPRPDLGGYEVVNDPEEEAEQPAAPEALVGGQLPAEATSATTAAVVAPTAGAAALAQSPGPVEREHTATLAGSARPSIGGTSPVAASQSLSPNGNAPPPTAVGSGTGLATTNTAPPVATGTSSSPAPAVASAALGTGIVASGTNTSGSKVFLYPKNGQSADQQARDRYDCYRFAVAQTGFDPLRAGSATAASGGETRSDFERAQSACFEARGYASR